MIDSSRLSFLGQSGLKALREARVSVVGAGGGGSLVVQQLAHLAVGIVHVIDPDRLERSNVNRIAGATYRDLGVEKAVLLQRRFSGLGSQVIPIVERAETPEAPQAIASSDVVIGAVDNYRSRFNVERMCRAALVPYIDIGLTIVLDTNCHVVAIGGQVVTSLANGPCLRCLDVVSEDRLAADREEYIAGAPEQQVISMNGILASQAVTTLLILITGFPGAYQPPPYLIYDGLMHELKKHPFLPDTAECQHFRVEDAGDRFALPPRRAELERFI